MTKDFIEKLYTITDRENVLTDEPMCNHTTFRIGGNADVLVNVSSEEIPKLIELCLSHDVSYVVLGNGSNVLVGDKGIRGVTIIIGKRMSDISVEGNVITVEAGALLSRVANVALKNNLAGMEFAAGVPGSVGGAVLMNAGAYGGEIKDIIVDAQVYTPEGVVKCYSKDELELSYRHSRISDEGGVILSARFELSEGNSDNISAVMMDLNKRRNDKQPLNLPSAGSTFKRPKGYFAGKLIQDAGMMGYRIGGAGVSDKHAGFVVNYDNATASDVRSVMSEVTKRVYEDSGVTLEPEVRLIGDFD